MVAGRADAGRGAADWSRIRARWRARSASTRPTARRRSSPQVFGGNRAAAGHGAVRRQLRRPPVRALGRTARRRPRDHAGRGGRTPPASAGSCSSRAPGRRRTRAAPTAARCCARRSASSCAARRCTTSACRPRARCRWSPPARTWCATCSTTATRRPSRARSCAASRRRSCASATSSCRPRAATTARCCGSSARLHASRATFRATLRRGERGAHERCTATGSRRSASAPPRLVAHWMRVGFVHGVMNTDNMSILGLTIDYGPYGWLDDFDPDWTPNTTDAHGRRYRFGQQPQIAHWNLVRLAQALSPLFASAEPLQAGLDRYAEAYTRRGPRQHRAQARPRRMPRCGRRTDPIAARAAAGRGSGHDAVLPRAGGGRCRCADRSIRCATRSTT